MKNRKKLLFILFPLLILLILLGRILFHPSFSTYTSRLFRQELAQDTITLHYTLSDPEAYGFKNMSASLGDFTYASFQKRIQNLKDQQVSLQNFLDQDLSEQDAMTAELLDWWLTGQIEMEDFYYFQEPLGPTLGVQAQLPVLLAEFAFRKEADVDLYLDLLKQLPDYFAQIIDFEREKASHGMGWNEAQCVRYLASFGITDTTQIHKLYLQLLEEPGNYLKYYLGYLEICKLKESALALSSNWSLYDFHNWFLTTGPAPFSILTEHLEDLEISPKLLKRMSQDFHLLSVQPFHDGRNHFLMKRRMLLVG